MHVRFQNGQIIDGPRALPRVWANIAGFDKLSAREMSRHNWYEYQHVEPPAHDERTQTAVPKAFLGTDYVVRPDYELVSLSEGEVHHRLAEERRVKLAELARIRWEHETAGITFDEIPLHTDRESHAAIALAAMQGDSERWKGEDGRWYVMSAERLQAAAQAVKDHVRACFTHEEALAAKLWAAATFDELDSINMEAGWPSV